MVLYTTGGLLCIKVKFPTKNQRQTQVIYEIDTSTDNAVIDFTKAAPSLNGKDKKENVEKD